MMMDIDELSTLCRVCMGPGYLPPTTHSKEKLLGSQNSSLLTKSLGSLFICFTSLNVREEAKEFPKHLCLKCLTKLRDYKDFRDEAMRTTKRLEEILNEKNSGFVNDDSCAEPERFVHETLVKCELTYEDDIKTERDEIIIDSNDNDNSYCNDNAASENDDNTLLLPELANMPLIKTEPMETETTFPFFENNLEESNVNKSKSDDNEYLHSNKGNDNNDSDKRGILEPNKNLSLKKGYRFICSECNKSFRNKNYLDAHVLAKHYGDEKPYKCKICLIAFKIGNDLNLHMLTCHTDEIKEVIPRNPRNDNNDRFNCKICGHNYASTWALTEHLKRHNKIKEHVCEECGVTKVTRRELQLHMRIHMPELKKFRCPQCPQEFSFKNAIPRHIKVVHEGVRPFKCSFCPRHFAKKSVLISHEFLHTGEKPFKCNMCPRGFVKKDSLVTHMKRKHDKI